jgi:CspA family cold shock protein
MERARGADALELVVYQQVQGGTKAMQENGRDLGTVQWFSRVKGYGFIRPDGQEEDVFVHYSAIQGEGYRNLNEGQRVEFTMEDTPKGPQAVDVVGLEGESEAFPIE